MDVEKGEIKREEAHGLLEEEEDEDGLTYAGPVATAHAQNIQSQSPYNLRLWICIVVNALSTIGIVCARQICNYPETVELEHHIPCGML